MGKKKILSKIKLNQLGNNEMDRRIMNILKGGKCSCMGGGGAREYWCKAVPASK